MARILIVEDEAAIAQLVKKMLEGMDHGPVTIAATGRQAVQTCRDQKPDLVLMDICLPGRMDGIDAARILKDELGLSVVYLTGTDSTTILERAKQTDPLGYLVKPFNKVQLQATVEMALHKKEVEHRIRESNRLLEEQAAELAKAYAQSRRIMEEKDRAQNTTDQLASFSRSNPFPAFQLDASCNVLFSNPAADRLLETSLKGFADRRNFCRVLFQPYLAQLAEKKEPATAEITIGDRHYLFTFVSVADPNRIYAYGTDISEQKVAEKERADIFALLLSTNEGMAHAFHILEKVERAQRTETGADIILDGLQPPLGTCKGGAIVLMQNRELKVISLSGSVPVNWSKGMVLPPGSFERCTSGECRHDQCPLELEGFGSRRHCFKSHVNAEVLAAALLWDLQAPEEDYISQYFRLCFSALFGLNTRHQLRKAKRLLEEQFRALQISEEKFKTLVTTVPDIVYRIDRNGIFEFVNDSISSLGYAAEELVGKHFSEIIFPIDVRQVSREGVLPLYAGKTTGDSDAPKLFDERRTGARRTHGLEVRLIPKKGAVAGTFLLETLVYDVVVVEVNSSGLYSTAGGDRDKMFVGTVGVIRDITERKEHELALRKAKDEADQASRAKGDFLANMSHEIRTPMNAITGMAHLLGQTGLSPVQQRYVANIHSASTSLLNIVNDILDISKIESGRIEIESTRFMLNQVFNSLSNMIRLKIYEKKLEFVIETSPEVPLALVGDPFRLEQVLLNLIGNAIKFTERGEVDVSIQRLWEVDGRVLLQFDVRDTGIGLSAEQISRLFDPFSQADTSTSRKFGGTGLGLAISKRLVHLMGGTIRVESTPGLGSTFIFTAEFGTTEEAGHRLALPSADMAGLRVLVVDDNSTALRVMTRCLESLSFVATPSASGEEAIRELERVWVSQAAPFDLVLMDSMMPEMDGLEAIRRIRELETCRSSLPPGPRHLIPVILLISDGWSEDWHEADALGIKGLLPKPATQSTIFDAVIAVFGHGNPPQSALDATLIPVPEQFDAIRGAVILVVEDNETNQEVARGLLENAGFQVVMAGNGRQAVERLRQQAQPQFDAVLMDLQMPQMDGYEATRRIRAWEAGRSSEETGRQTPIPIIAMTAEVVGEVRRLCTEAGMNDYVSKPVDPKELFSALTRWITPANRQNPPAAKERIATQVPTYHDPSSLPDSLPGINLRGALNRIGGNQSLYKKLLLKFSTDHAGEVEAIRDALKSGDAKTATRLAHTLKGVAGTIGAQTLSEAAAMLETALKNQDNDLDGLFDQVSVCLQTVVQSITSLNGPKAQTRSEPAGRPGNIRETLFLLDELKALLEDNDADALQKLELAREALKGSDEMDGLDVIEQALGNYDSETALAELDRFVRRLKGADHG